MSHGDSLIAWLASQLQQDEGKDTQESCVKETESAFPNVSIQSASLESAKGISVYAKQNIPGGSTIGGIPMPCLITPFTVPEELEATWKDGCWVIPLLNGTEVKLNHAGMTILSLLIEYQKGFPESFFTPYLKSLPRRVPSLMSLPESCRIRLKITTIGDTMAQILDHRTLFYDDVLIPVFQKLGRKGFLLAAPSGSMLHWACDIYYSRALKLPKYAIEYLTSERLKTSVSTEPKLKKKRLLDDPDSGPSSILAHRFDALGQYGDVSALIPLADLMNHDPRSTNRWASVRHKNALQLIAGRTISSGSEIPLNYGIRSNHDLAVSFGFTLQENQADTVHTVKCNDGRPRFEKGELTQRLYYPHLLTSCVSKREGSSTAIENSAGSISCTDLIKSILHDLAVVPSANGRFETEERIGDIQPNSLDADYCTPLQGNEDPRIEAIQGYLQSQETLLQEQDQKSASIDIQPL